MWWLYQNIENIHYINYILNSGRARMWLLTGCDIGDGVDTCIPDHHPQPTFHTHNFI